MVEQALEFANGRTDRPSYDLRPIEIGADELAMPPAAERALNLTVAALTAANGVLIPLQCETLSHRGVGQLLDTVHDEALPPKRREEVDRRLWWGYKKLGRRRAQAGEYEAAAEALFHALRFAGVGTDRQADTRAALVRALEGLVEKRALLIRELAESADREAAVVQSDKLWSRLRGALRDGLTEEDLAVAFAKAQRVFAEIGVRP